VRTNWDEGKDRAKSECESTLDEEREGKEQSVHYRLRKEREEVKIKESAWSERILKDEEREGGGKQQSKEQGVRGC
jgi:hypothetical protein